jgi:TolB-like protein
VLYICTELKTGGILGRMGAVAIGLEAVQEELDRVLASSGFSRNERLSRFLRFIVERQLEGRDQELKESVIGTEVFGRRPDYDPKQDSIVRSEAARLRSRLVEYYAGKGSLDPIIIELPKGGYIPAIRSARPDPPASPLSQHRQVRWVAAAVLLLTAIAIALWSFEIHRAPLAIAVLPLENLGHDPQNDYFVDGLTDELIRNLSLIEGLETRSRSSSFEFKGKPRNVHTVSRELDVAYVLEGSVLRAGQQLRINVQLVRTHDDFPVWSGQYDRELSDVLAIQDDISRGVVNRLRLKLGRGRRRYETSEEAYDLYLRARAIPYLGNRVALYRQAVAKDSGFAPAYAGLAFSYAFRSGFPELDRPEELSNMKMAAEKAIELDPLLAEAHAALGVALARDAQWEQSEKSFRRALDSDPNSADSRREFATDLLLPLGRVQEAVQQLRAAEKADPLSRDIQRSFGYALLSAGKYGEAAVHCQKAADAQCLGRARLGQGRIKEAIEILGEEVNRGIPVGDPTRGYLGYAYARSGDRGTAEQIAQAQEQFAFHQAIVFAGLGDKERVFQALSRMTELGPARVGRALTLPELALVRGDPRVKTLRKQVRLPEQ